MTSMSKPRSCQVCPLSSSGVGFTPHQPVGPSGLVIVGETPFIGARKVGLERLLKRAGIDPMEVGIASIISCVPSGWKNPTYHPLGRVAANECGQHLDPITGGAKAFLWMGEWALQQSGGVVNLERQRGRYIQRPDGRWGVATYAPEFLLPKRGKERKGELKPFRFGGVVIADIRRAMRIAREGAPTIRPMRPEWDISPAAFTQWAARRREQLRQKGVLYYDIETSYGIKLDEQEQLAQSGDTILRVSFATDTTYGLSVPFTPHYLPGIRLLLTDPHTTKAGWNNHRFDDIVLARGGVQVPSAHNWDLMWAWKILQSDLPMGLEFASSVLIPDTPAWKHLSQAEPGRYSALDAVITARMGEELQAALMGTSQWGLFLDHMELDPILVEAGRRGTVLHQPTQDLLRAQLDAEKTRLFSAAQAAVPMGLKPTKRYKKWPIKGVDPDAHTHSDLGKYVSLATMAGDGVITPRTFAPILVEGKTTRCSVCGQEGVTKGVHLKGGKKKNSCVAGGAVITKTIAIVREWDEILPFNPDSPQQMMAYARHHGHPIGKDKKDENKEAMDGKHVAKLAKRYAKTHPLYKHAGELKKVTKTRGTYLYTADAAGLVHTTYDYTPSTGRLASKNVNLQNVGKRESNKWAKLARKQLIARPGHVFVQADSSAIEAVMVGWFMGDQNYIDIARKSIHSYLACFSLGIPFTPGNVQLVKGSHKKLYDGCKVTVHSSSYGATAGALTLINDELFPRKKIAQEFQDLLFTALPTLSDWHKDIRWEAHTQGYLQNPWGWRHYFYRVLVKDPKTGELVPGEDAKRAIALKPQSSAGACMKDSLLLLGRGDYRRFMPAHVSVHDSLCLEVPVPMQREAEDYLIDLLTRPIPQMDGLRVGCEVEVGENWGELETTRVVNLVDDPEWALGA